MQRQPILSLKFTRTCNSESTNRFFCPCWTPVSTLMSTLQKTSLEGPRSIIKEVREHFMKCNRTVTCGSKLATRLTYMVLERVVSGYPKPSGCVGRTVAHYLPISKLFASANRISYTANELPKAAELIVS